MARPIANKTRKTPQGMYFDLIFASDVIPAIQNLNCQLQPKTTSVSRNYFTEESVRYKPYIQNLNILTVLLTSTLAINCLLRNFLNMAIGIINFAKPFLNIIDDTMI